MPRPTPTIVAVFFGGALVGALLNQTLHVAGAILTRGRPVVPAVEFEPAPSATAAALPFDASSAAFLAELQEQQGSVLKGTSLELSIESPTELPAESEHDSQ